MYDYHLSLESLKMKSYNMELDTDENSVASSFFFLLDVKEGVPELSVTITMEKY